MNTFQTFDDFIKAWDGKHCEVAGSADAKNQCVDLANAYIRDVLGLLIIEWTNAVDFPAKAGSNYEFIVNSPAAVPRKGDLIIWKPSPGHIAIFIEGDVNRFTSFDQNFPLYSVCHVQEHNYTNVIGWLRYKDTNAPVVDTVCQKQLLEEIQKKETLWIEKTEIEAKLANRVEQVSRLENRVLQLEKLNSSYQQALNQDENNGQVIENLTKMNRELQDEANQLGRDKGTLIVENQKLLAKVKLLEDSGTQRGFALILRGFLTLF